MSVMTSYRLMNLAGGLWALCTASFAQPSQVGRLDFLKSKDPTFALFGQYLTYHLTGYRQPGSEEAADWEFALCERIA